MTYTYKLARRLARLRIPLAVAFAVAAACTEGELMQPEGEVPGDLPSQPVSWTVLPDSILLETKQLLKFQAKQVTDKADPSSVDVEWVATGGSITPEGEFSSDSAGEYVVYAKRKGKGRRAQRDSSIVIVVPPVPELQYISVSPDTSRVIGGQSTTYTATGVLRDSSRVPVGVHWTATGGTVTVGGVYTAGSMQGTYRVTATNGSSGLTDTATVVIQSAPPPPAPEGPAEVVLLPASLTLQTGQQRQFASYGRTSSGDSVAVTVTYTANGGTVTATGLYTAGTVAGTGRIIAKEPGGKTDTSIVTISAPPPSGTPGDTTWPSIANVEVMDALSAQHVRQGLGFQVDPGNAWELQIAKDIGASEVRFQTSWDYVEREPGRRALAPGHVTGLNEAARLGLDVQAVAAYGPGWTTPLTLTVAANVGSGSTTIPVQETGALGSIIPYRDHARRSDGNMLVAVGYWSYAGAILAGVQGNSLVLGAPLVTSLAAGQRINVNRRAYAPPANPGDPGDPSILAYRDYALFLANEMSNRGVKGHVELWNEPPWDHDHWDGGRGCFLAGHAGCQPISRGMGALFSNTPAPPGVHWNWAAPHKSGTASVLWDGSNGVKPRSGSGLTQESIHPYGGSPEWGLWNPHCLRTKALAESMSCVWVGMNQGANHKVAYKYALDYEKATGFRINYTITEHGALMNDRVAQARYFMRSFFAYLGGGMQRVSFYRLAGDNTWGIVDIGTRALYPAASSLKAMMTDLTPLAAQAPSRTEGRPAVTAYSGTQWPLMVAPVLGRSAGASRNSYWLVVWQRTHPATNWASIPHPAGANVTVRLPDGYRISSAVELTSRTTLPVSGNVVSGVRDEPVAIRVEP